MLRSTARRAVALLLELLLVVLVFVGGGAECAAVPASDGTGAHGHGAHAGPAPGAPAADGHGHEHGQAHGEAALPSPSEGQAPEREGPACVLMVVCAASLAPGEAVVLTGAVLHAAEHGPAGAPSSRASVVRAVETPPPRLRA